MDTAMPIACFLSVIRPPGIQFENALLQIAPVNKGKCPFVRDNNDIVFQLYTRHNPTVAHSLLIDDDESLFASSIDFNDPTVIYFHAFMETPDDGSALMVREAYTHRGDTNVIVVDAQRLEAGPWYFKAAENTWYIGRIAAQFIDYLVSRGLKLSKTHLVGHSLGAQSAGVAGGSIQSGLVSRITGLDPALPLFDKVSLSQRLDPSDAEFVDVIHTDAGIFGFNQQVGHVDFYPNGGISPQPGCELEVVIPKQLLLNKCDNKKKLHGFFVFQLQEKHSNTETIDKIDATARNGIVTPVKIIRKNITKEKKDTKKHRLLKRPKIITDETSKKIINGPKRPEYKTKRTFIKHRHYIAQFLEKPQGGNEKMAKVFRKYKISDSTKKSINGQNQKIDGRMKSKPKHRRFFIPFFTRPQTIENDDMTKIFGKLKTSDSKTTKKIVTKSQKTSKRKKRSQIEKPHHRQRRFTSFFNRPQNSENMLFKILDFLIRNRQKIAPTISIIREINTIIKTSNGVIQNIIKEQNNIIGDNAGNSKPISSTYNFEIANESKIKSFLRKLFGLGQGNKLVVTAST